MIFNLQLKGVFQLIACLKKGHYDKVDYALPQVKKRIFVLSFGLSFGDAFVFSVFVYIKLQTSKQ